MLEKLPGKRSNPYNVPDGVGFDTPDWFVWTLIILFVCLVVTGIALDASL
jgi:hypothetical protein